MNDVLGVHCFNSIMWLLRLYPYTFSWNHVQNKNDAETFELFHFISFYLKSRFQNSKHSCLYFVFSSNSGKSLHLNYCLCTLMCLCNNKASVFTSLLFSQIWNKRCLCESDKWLIDNTSQLYFRSWLKVENRSSEI